MTSVPTHLRKRYVRERRFRLYGLAALLCVAAMLAFLLIALAGNGMKGMMQARLTLPVSEALRSENLSPELLVKRVLQERFPDVTERREKRQLFSLLAPSVGRYVTLPLGETITIPMADTIELWIKDGRTPADTARFAVSKAQQAWVQSLHDAGLIDVRFNTGFFTHGDSRDPERAGYGGAILGSLFVLSVCMAVALPVGIGAAVYLEEFAKPSRWRDMVEVSINNLAAIPSIIFGLLGLFLYIVLMGLPRSSALVGGLTLALMTLPVIIISSRVALAAVPSSLRDGARALGASPLQVVTHHVLPQAMSGIITGAILGFARAIGETAPLLMIGMVAFIATPPSIITDPATAMPVQIYLWASSPEQGFVQKTASAIVILVGILLVLNLIATYLRYKSEQKR
jgi:phosphate transport system permease protein